MGSNPTSDTFGGKFSRAEHWPLTSWGLTTLSFEYSVFGLREMNLAGPGIRWNRIGG